MKKIALGLGIASTVVLLGMNIREVAFKAGLASVALYLFGGWSQLLDVLMFMVIADYATGIGAACVEKRLSSAIGFRRIPKKLFIFLAVAAAHKVDLALNSPGFFRNITIYFYIANEGLSMLENMVRCGMPVPPQLRSALLQLRKRSEEEKQPPDTPDRPAM
ncbi:phage holin family protein [Aneurinibacillus migulanus]|uniref:Holin, Cph1 family n=2 Tax=Aneurinibacillus migulanus TaxID=47500 RepID=A0A1G8WDY1_ANEMI|nr:phage holin family protein [Aneurinibacillus migulanus]MED0894870.1 phage holin family protein [Aneurinibacillus migulanus]MED1614379.1 phage holin family protein [Aneurinibacillus migulanus]SDJ76484.1 holin, Cph1 family [Aneurinibacillus migulanus]